MSHFIFPPDSWVLLNFFKHMTLSFLLYSIRGSIKDGMCRAGNENKVFIFI